MQKSKILTPVLVEVNKIKYKLLYINLTKDGSIYVLFPRRNGYKIIKDKNMPTNAVGEITLSLDKVSETFKLPYISFHPGKKSVHINCSDDKIYKVDANVINLAEDKNILSFPMCQIIFPTFRYIDEYDNKKHTTPLVINSKSLSPEIGLNIEIWIHPINTYIDPQDLPYHNKKIQKMNFINALKFQNSFLRQYTCTLVLWEIPVNIKKSTIPGVIVSVPNGHQQYIFEMVPVN